MKPQLAEIGFKLFFGFLSFIVLVGIIVFFGILSKAEDETEMVYRETIEIAALNDNLGNNDEFFLGSGKSEGTMYYYFVISTERGQQMIKAKAEDSFIVEGDYEPHVKIYDEVYSNEFVKKIRRNDVVNERAEYEFYLPKDAIETGFKIDLQ